MLRTIAGRVCGCLADLQNVKRIHKQAQYLHLLIQLVIASSHEVFPFILISLFQKFGLPMTFSTFSNP
jgi:hypothetical protein